MPETVSYGFRRGCIGKEIREVRAWGVLIEGYGFGDVDEIMGNSWPKGHTACWKGSTPSRRYHVG